ncbi:uncharacterized protein A1O9_09826 [Exophiala aquamarina CBS 119918]|uniref:Enoyl reductase (ER) domain-containing protein n=1 Tax=Exophiala aquamarina CBS 119918 TaxID=1182545 RepID=A0A072P2E1_9EURO|nr:uncharacterized protein A1O9_09826 [Exophiala aquamarina CBS 119918]KEF54031.1 hypothetical protein A1O9_09826 [Exophiala aquamarina CBS 119918]
MATQIVYRLVLRGGFDGLQPIQEPVPHAGKYEILVRFRSAALNFRDIAIAKDTFPLPVKENVVPCSDMSGEVVQLSEEVRNFSIGDRVIAPVSLVVLYGPVKDEDNSLGGSVDGVLRQYLVLPAHATVKLPQSSHSFSEWAASVTTAYTVWNAFYGCLSLKPGQTVLLLDSTPILIFAAGTGGVSLTGLIFAKAAGATAIITSSSDEKLDYVKKKYGVDHTINYKTRPQWAMEVNRITHGEGVDNVLEVGEVGTVEQSIDSVAWGGVTSVIGFLSSLDDEKMPNGAFQTLAKGAILRVSWQGPNSSLRTLSSLLEHRISRYQWKRHSPSTRRE